MFSAKKRLFLRLGDRVIHAHYEQVGDWALLWKK